MEARVHLKTFLRLSVPAPTQRASTNEILATAAAILTPTKHVRMLLNDAEKIILLQEIITSKAHIAMFGSVQKKFKQAAKPMDAHSNVRFKVKERDFKKSSSACSVNSVRRITASASALR